MNTQPELKFDRKRYQIAKTCPCGKSNRDGKFVPYKGFEDRGYCHSCGKTFLPPMEREVSRPIERKPEPPPSYISPKILKSTLAGYQGNSFVQFLINTFGQEVTAKVVGKYFLGSTRKGEACFWQIDRAGKIRSGKIIAYNPITGHRLKDVDPTWVHKQMNLEPFNLKQCLFGAHLLKGNSKPAAVVESEKTAVICSLYFPDFLWLASGGIDGLQTEKMKALKGRKVILFPDLDGFELWTIRARELEPMLNITVSNLLEQKATPEERKGKLDLADYLIKFPIEDRKQYYVETTLDGRQMLMHPTGQPASWELTPLEKLIAKNPYISELVKKFDLIPL